MELYSLWNSTLARDPHLRRLMDDLEAKTRASWKAMMDLGIVEACRRCEEEEGGSCCGAGIENRYDPYLLLANLLAGVTLPGERRRPNECFFLGETGCRLRIRHFLCINYLCMQIQKMLSHGDLVLLQGIIGGEMDTVFLLQERILAILKKGEGMEG